LAVWLIDNFATTPAWRDAIERLANITDADLSMSKVGMP
jgi:hypothetical protein